MRRLAPRPLAGAVESLAQRLQPATPLAEVQRLWPEVAGAVIAREARPVSERDGVVSVVCRSAVWAHELRLLGPELAGRLNAAIGREVVRELRCSTTAPKSAILQDFRNR